MSSFICSPKHFNSIEKSILELIEHKNDFYFSSDIVEKYPKLENETSAESKAQIIEIIDELRTLNVLCVVLQYKDHYHGINEEIQGHTKLLFFERTKYKHLTELGLFNALRCLNYQIEPEHLDDFIGLTEAQQNALYFLDYLTNKIAKRIVRSLPEDHTNTWEVN